MAYWNLICRETKSTCLWPEESSGTDRPNRTCQMLSILPPFGREVNSCLSVNGAQMLLKIHWQHAFEMRAQHTNDNLCGLPGLLLGGKNAELVVTGLVSTLIDSQKSRDPTVEQFGVVPLSLWCRNRFIVDPHIIRIFRGS